MDFLNRVKTFNNNKNKANILLKGEVLKTSSLRLPGFNPWVEKFLWRREWQSSPVFLPGEFHGERSLVGYSPWSCKESDMTEWLTYAHTAIKVTLLQAQWYYHLNFQMRNLKLSEAKWLCTKPDSKSRAAPEWKPRSPDPLFCSQHQFVSSSSLRKPVPSLE